MLSYTPPLERNQEKWAPLFRSNSRRNVIERARPLLGTIVAIRVHGLGERFAQSCIDEAFDEIARVHRLMSFHEIASDVSRLNCDAIEAPVPVHHDTWAVLAEALALSVASDGCFDISIGARLVDRGLLPRPLCLREPDPEACWRDIELCAEGRVRFHRPLWIDLGGIAKGYAVDRAFAVLRAAGAERAVVNAGGDLRVLGPRTEPVYLKAASRQDAAPIVMIAEGSLASSGSIEADFASPHIDPAAKTAPRGFVAVAAERCLIADALTKIVLVRREDAEPLLRRHEALAYLCERAGSWLRFGMPT